MSKSKNFSEFENVVFIVDGGLGKNIMATVVVRNIKKKYPDKKLIVICGYPDVFLNNPNIHKVYNFANALYFYKDYIELSRSLILKIEPYLHLKYLYKEWSLTEAWCDTLGVPFDNNVPELFFLENEKKAAKFFFESKKMDPKYTVMLQWVGGPPPNAKTEQEQSQRRASMYRRSLPVDKAQELVDKLIDKKYNVLSVQHPHHPDLKGVTNISYGTRSVIMLLTQARFFIGIDSFLQHAARAVEKKGIVLWGGTSPVCLGYDYHLNMTREVCTTPHCHRPNSYTFDIQAHGFMWDCPYNDECMNFDPKEIVEKFKELK